MTEKDVEALVLDFCDAFWNVPLLPSERRYFASKFRGKIYVFLRAAQGSRNGPLSWASVISVVQRLCQSLFVDYTAVRRFNKPRALVRIQTYVDDPIITACGSLTERRRSFVKITAVWLILGFRVAFDKARQGSIVVWIGAELHIRAQEVEVRITEEKLADLGDSLTALLARNVMGEKKLRAFLGKAENIATIIIVWRPFLREVWAAMMAALSGETSRAPKGCIWTSQMRDSLEVFVVFLSRLKGDLRRTYRLQAYLRRGASIVMGFDASPWGLGGWLKENGRIVSYFVSQLTPADEARYGVPIGSPKGQQIWEALAILCGFKVWRNIWLRERASFTVVGDNVAALSMTAKVRAPSLALNGLAKELAVELGDGTFMPDFLSHVPGATHDVADGLSRKFQPDVSWTRPDALASAREVSLPSREVGFYHFERA